MCSVEVVIQADVYHHAVLSCIHSFIGSCFDSANAQFPFVVDGQFAYHLFVIGLQLFFWLCLLDVLS